MRNQNITNDVNLYIPSEALRNKPVIANYVNNFSHLMFWLGLLSMGLTRPLLPQTLIEYYI